MPVDTENIEIIVCAVIDPRYDMAMYGTYHALRNGKTLCGRYPRNTRSTVWDSKSRLHDPEDITCKRCRKCLGLIVGRGDSQVML